MRRNAPPYRCTWPLHCIHWWCKAGQIIVEANIAPNLAVDAFSQLAGDGAHGIK